MLGLWPTKVYTNLSDASKSVSKKENLHICDVISMGEVTSSKTGCRKDGIHYYSSSSVGHRHLESLGGN